VLGGDDNWGGDIRVQVNGGDTFDWLGVADGGALDSASLMGFYTQTNALGQLDLLFTVPNGNFAGISGVIVSQAAAVPEPASVGLWAMVGLVGLLGIAWRKSSHRGR
jgi:hypothetical protein